jgi:tetratricopeptide (TPR) repeat protein
VLSLWRRAGGSAAREVTPEAAVGIAQRLGAGRLIDGGVVGTPDHVTLTASVLQIPSGKRTSPVSVEGPPDSVPALVDRLTAQLLAGESGRTELASLTSLPALRAYFDGQRAYRLGRWADALQAFWKATQTDSTFALAAMGFFSASLWTDGRLPAGTDPGRAVALAWANRARLSARDRALLLAQIGPRYPAPTPESEFLAARQRGVAADPDSPEMWYELGDEYFHFGAKLGVDSSLSRAAYAFRRSLALDSASGVFATFAEPLIHLVEMAATDGDTATVRRLVTTALTADSLIDQAGFLRWAMATASRDSAAIRSVRNSFPQMGIGSLILIANSSQEMGVGWKDAQLAAAAGLRAGPGALILAHVLALNRGRPREALAALQGMPEHSKHERLRWRVVDALYWDGDNAAAAEAVRELQRYAAAPPAQSADDRDAQYQDLCVEQQWRLARGDLASAGSAIGRLRAANGADVCATVHETWLAVLDKRPDAALLLGRLDSLSLSGAIAVPRNLVVARLHEAVNDPRGALAAIRRRSYGFQPSYLSTCLREEGRLAALTGDTASAIAAYRHYLALRSDPEPAVKPVVERVRAELAALVAEPQ